MRGLGVLVLAVITVGCGDATSSPGSVLGASPTPVLNSAADNSCPHDAPAGFNASGYGTRADLTWAAVPNITDYQIEIDRYDVSNSFLPAARFITQNTTRAEWYGTTGSKYRARLRTRTACGTFGVWTSYATFSIDADAKAPAPPSPINPESCEALFSTLHEDSEQPSLPSCPCSNRLQALLPEDPEGPSCPPIED